MSSVDNPPTRSASRSDLPTRGRWNRGANVEFLVPSRGRWNDGANVEFFFSSREWVRIADNAA